MPSNTSPLIQCLSQGIIKTFKAYFMRELYTKACETLDTSEETTMIDYWKSVTVRNTIDYVGTASSRLSSITVEKTFGLTVQKILKVLQKI
jgi:hypothetical protein